jgi:hypothetical protein
VRRGSINPLMDVEEDAVTARSSPAEIRLHDRKLAFRGALIGVTGKIALMRLRSVPKHVSAPVQGEVADLIAIDRGKVVAALVAIESVRGVVVSLRFAESGTRSERRMRPRRSVDMPVSLRSVSASGARGAWLTGRVLDLSTGGLRLHYQPAVLTPDSVEICLVLSEMEQPQSTVYGSTVSTRALPSTTKDPGIIRTTCRVAGVRQSMNGLTEIRLAFRALTDANLLTLASFLSAKTSEPVPVEKQAA